MGKVQDAIHSVFPYCRGGERDFEEVTQRDLGTPSGARTT